MKRPLFLISCLFYLLTAATSSPAATSARLQVSATVPPFVSFNAVQNVTSYQVHDADIKRGYLDLPNTLTVTLRTNLATAIPVQVEHNAGTDLQLRESGTSVFHGSTFSVANSDRRSTVPVRRNYDSRLILGKGTKEGTYPLVISMFPAP